MTDNNKFIPKIPETKTEIVIDQKQQEQAEQKNPITEKVKEAVVPTVHASDDDKEGNEGAKQVIGAELAAVDAVAPPVGAAASVVSSIGGAFTEGIGKMTGNEDMRQAGEAYKEAPIQPIKEAGKAIEKASE